MSNGYELYAVFVAKKRRTYQDVQGRSSQNGIGRGSSRHRHAPFRGRENAEPVYELLDPDEASKDSGRNHWEDETRNAGEKQEHGGTNEVLRGLAALLRTTMTMRHLLMHTSGLSYWIPTAGSGLLPTVYRQRGITPGDYYYAIQGRPGYGPQVKSLSAMIARLAELPLAADPGTAYQYSISSTSWG